MIETARRDGVRRSSDRDQGERPNLHSCATGRLDRETEASVILAATLPACLCDHDGAPPAAHRASQVRSDSDAVVHDVYCRISQRLPGRIHDLRVEPAQDSSLEISGVAASYYVKQLAQHIAMDVARLQRVINHIEVRVPR